MSPRRVEQLRWARDGGRRRRQARDVGIARTHVDVASPRGRSVNQTQLGVSRIQQLGEVAAIDRARVWNQRSRRGTKLRCLPGRQRTRCHRGLFGRRGLGRHTGPLRRPCALRFGRWDGLRRGARADRDPGHHARADTDPVVHDIPQRAVGASRWSGPSDGQPYHVRRGLARRMVAADAERASPYLAATPAGS